MKEEITYRIDSEDMTRFFQGVKEEFYHLFDNIEVTTATVADIKKCHPVTISRWNKNGKLRPTNPGSGIYKFRLSDVLRGSLKYKHNV